MPPSVPLFFGRYRELAAAVAAQLESSRNPDPLRAWTAEVVVASHGVAEAIARVLGERGRGMAGLQLRTIDGLARRIANDAGEFPRVATDAERRLAMRSAIHSVDDPILQGRGIAAMLERSYRDVRDSGLTLDELRRRARTAPLRNSDRTRLVLRVWGEYERLVGLLGAIDPAALLARAAELLDRGAAVVPQIVAGFYDLTGAQRAVVDALARAGRLAGIHVPAGDSESYRFAQPLIASLREMKIVRSSPLSPPQRGEGPRSGGEGSLASAEDPSSGLRPPSPRCGGEKGLDSTTPRNWSVSEHERRDAEIAETCTSIAALLQSGTPPQSIGIVARSLDPADVHLFNRFAERYGFRTTAAEELPLIGHRIGRGVANILRIRERGLQRVDVLELIRDGFRPKTRINVDKADEEARKRRIAGGSSDDLAPFRERSLVLRDYVELVKELEDLTSAIASPLLRGSDWSDFLISVAGRFTVRTESDVAAAQEIEAIAALFANGERMNIRFDAASVLDALECGRLARNRGTSRAAELEASAPGETPGASGRDARTPELPQVWLGDVMRFRGHGFEHLFAVRMQDELFPQRRLEDPLLPDSDRRLLGVRQIGDGRDEERLLFQLMLDGTSSIHFSFAGSDGFGKILRPSQLLKNFVIEQQPERKQELLRDFSKAIANGRSSGHRVTESPGEDTTRSTNPVTRRPRDPATPIRQLQLIARAGTNGPFDGFIDDDALRQHFAHALEHVSPTQLEDFGECPQKFLLKVILKVESVEDPDRELQINPRDKGSLDHRILENFYRGMSDDDLAEAEAQLPQLPVALVSRLEAAIDAEFDRLDATAPPFNRNVRAIERRATRRILRDFVVRDLADLAENGLRPRWFEYSFGDKYQRREGGATHPEPFVVTAAGIPISIEGQIDRIDVGGHEVNLETSKPRDLATSVHFRIVDYKSGKAIRHVKLADKIDRGVRLQLALYAMAVAQFFGISETAIRGTIKPLVTGDQKLASYGFDLATHVDGVRATLEIFASSIARGFFPAYPDDRDFISCKYCPVNHSCRTKHDAEEARAVRQSKDPRTLLGELGERR